MDDALQTLALVTTGLAIAGFGLALWWTPRDSPVFTPVRWLLWLAVAGLVLLFTFDLIDAANLVPSAVQSQLWRRLSFRGLMLVDAVGFLILAGRVLRLTPRNPSC